MAYILTTSLALLWKGFFLSPGLLFSTCFVHVDLCYIVSLYMLQMENIYTDLSLTACWMLSINKFQEIIYQVNLSGNNLSYIKSRFPPEHRATYWRTCKCCVTYLLIYHNLYDLVNQKYSCYTIYLFSYSFIYLFISLHNIVSMYCIYTYWETVPCLFVYV